MNSLKFHIRTFDTSTNMGFVKLVIWVVVRPAKRLQQVFHQSTVRLILAQIGQNPTVQGYTHVSSVI